MANTVPAAPISAFPVVIAGPTGPTGPQAAANVVEELQAAMAQLAKRMASVEDKLNGLG